MKKIVLFLVVLFLPIVLFGKDNPTFGKFSIKPENDGDWKNYTNYVGKIFRYLPSSPEGAIEREIHFYGNKGEDYILSEVKKGVGYYDIQLVFTSVKEPKTKVRIKLPNKNMGYLPLFNMDAFEEEKANYVGKTYSHPQVKQTYIISDVIIKEQEVGLTGKKYMPTYIFDDGREYHSLDNIESRLFAKALSGAYYSTLVQVEKPEDAADKYSEVKTFDEEGINKFSFEDELLSIVIFGDSKQFNFRLTNKSQNTIKIIWDDAVFVGTDGTSSKIMHVGTKYSQKDASQPASTIIRNASLNDIACPTANVRYSDVLKEWVTDSMYPQTPSKDVKQVRLMLPIQIKEVENEYVFVFDVKYRYNHPELLNYE